MCPPTCNETRRKKSVLVQAYLTGLYYLCGLARLVSTSQSLKMVSTMRAAIVKVSMVSPSSSDVCLTRNRSSQPSIP